MSYSPQVIAFNSDRMTIRSAIEGDISTLRKLFENSRIEGQTRENDTGADLEFLSAGYFECNESGFWLAQYDERIVAVSYTQLTLPT